MSKQINRSYAALPMALTFSSRWLSSLFCFLCLCLLMIVSGVSFAAQGSRSISTPNINTNINEPEPEMGDVAGSSVSGKTKAELKRLNHLTDANLAQAAIVTMQHVQRDHAPQKTMAVLDTPLADSASTHPTDGDKVSNNSTDAFKASTQKAKKLTEEHLIAQNISADLEPSHVQAGAQIAGAQANSFQTNNLQTSSNNLITNNLSSDTPDGGDKPTDTKISHVGSMLTQNSDVNNHVKNNKNSHAKHSSTQKQHSSTQSNFSMTAKLVSAAKVGSQADQVVSDKSLAPFSVPKHNQAMVQKKRINKPLNKPLEKNQSTKSVKPNIKTKTRLNDDKSHSGLSAEKSSKNPSLATFNSTKQPKKTTSALSAQAQRLERLANQLKKQHASSAKIYSSRHKSSLALQSALLSKTATTTEEKTSSLLTRLSNLASRSINRFRQTGIASWYGRQFQGKITANGETYDMHQLTAAHSSLPMSCYIKVTNEENGKSVVVKVNDRVSNTADRIVDLSYAAAQKIGLTKASTGKVSIERLVETPVN